MNTTTLKSLVVAAVALSGLASLQAAVFTFDDNPGWNDGLSAAGDNSNVWTYSNSGGIGNSGWLKTVNPPGGGNSVQESYIVSDAFDPGREKITVGVYFFWEGDYSNSTASDHYLIRLGIGRGAGTADFKPQFGAPSSPLASSDQQLDIGFAATANPNVVRIRGNRIVDGLRGPALNTPIVDITLEQKSWYYLEANFTLNLTGTAYDLSLSLFESDSEGVLDGTSLLSWSATPEIPGLLTGNLHAFFAGRQSKFGNVVGVDNFTAHAIPESGSVALLGVGAAAMLFGGKAFRGLRK